MYSAENLNEVQGEVADLIESYYVDDRLLDGLPRIEMDWDIYDKLQEAGLLILLTARYDGELAGALLYMISTAPHYKGIKFATCDLLSVSPSFRGRGIATELVALGEMVLRARDVRFVQHHFRTVYNAEPLFNKLGFKLTEHVYLKELV